MKVARAELLRRVSELGQRRDEQEKLLQRLEVRTYSIQKTHNMRYERANFEYVIAVADQGKGRG